MILADLLRGAPPGEYLLDQRGGWRLLLKLSEGDPGDAALAPSLLGMLRLAPPQPEPDGE